MYSFRYSNINFVEQSLIIYWIVYGKLRSCQRKKIKKYISNMPSLSTTISMVQKVCNSPETTANDLNRVIALDPVLTGNVLKLINSAYNSLRDRVTFLTKAIIMLGGPCRRYLRNNMLSPLSLYC